MWYDKLVQIWKIKDLRKNVLFVLALLVVTRIAGHIPMPGVNVANLRNFFESNQILGLLNLFSGGGMENFSVVLMGVSPYITASIIFQLLVMIIPQLEELSKDPGGQQKINQYTRIITVPLAILQAYAMISLLRQSSRPIITDLNITKLVIMLITITAGTMFIMWIGELISERKVGNGISLIIFTGIITRIPEALQRTFLTYDASQIFTLLLFVAVAVITIVGVVIITEGQRNVPVSYARQIRGMRMYGGTSTHLPLRVNMAGVIPIIFAVSIIIFPPMIAQFFLKARTVFLVHAAQWVIRFSRINWSTAFSTLFSFLVLLTFILRLFFIPIRSRKICRSRAASYRASGRGELRLNISRQLLAGLIFPARYFWD